MSAHPGSATIVTVANIKGGSGKSTLSMNLCVGLMYQGYRVLCLDADKPQYSLHRYVSNRDESLQHIECYAAADSASLVSLIESKRSYYDFVLIDTPGALTDMTQTAHELADVVLTPLNDSLLDLDLLVHVQNNAISTKLGAYGEFMWNLRKQRSLEGRRLDWIVVRNRLAVLYNKNKEKMYGYLKKLAKTLGFELLPGVTERVIYKNCFDSGLTVFDLDASTLTSSQLMARQEIRGIVSEIIHSAE